MWAGGATDARAAFRRSFVPAAEGGPTGRLAFSDCPEGCGGGRGGGGGRITVVRGEARRSVGSPWHGGGRDAACL